MEFSGPFLFRAPFSDKGPVSAVEQPQVLQRESQPGFFAKVGKLSMGSCPNLSLGHLEVIALVCIEKAHGTYAFC